MKESNAMRSRFVALLMFVGCGTAVDTSVVEKVIPNVSPPTANPVIDASSERLTELAIGDPAPPLRIGGFLKGEPFMSFEPGKIYVVEFSATWCGPCRAAIPHLTELQNKYPDVTFLSVYVREDDRSAPAKFIETMGDRIGYRVTVDDVPSGEAPETGAMYRTWMKPAEETAIPTVFVVNGNGHVAAITHQAVLDEPLEKIVTDKWNIEEAAAKHRNVVVENRRQRAFDQRLAAILKPPLSDEMLKDLSQLKAEYPKERFEDEATSIAWAALRRFLEPDGNVEMARAAAKDFEEGRPPEYVASILNGLAWSIVDPQRSQAVSEPLLRFALDAARRADELSNEGNWQIADTLARVLQLHGNPKLALRAQQRAVRLALVEPDPDLHILAELRDRLREYAVAVGNDLPDQGPR